MGQFDVRTAAHIAANSANASGRDGVADRRAEAEKDRPEETGQILSDLAPVLLTVIDSLQGTAGADAAA